MNICLSHDFVSPDVAVVVLAARNDNLALVVELTTEYFVSVPFENLEQLSTFAVPEPSSAIRPGRENLGTLRVEECLAYLSLVTYPK